MLPMKMMMGSTSIAKEKPPSLSGPNMKRVPASVKRTSPATASFTPTKKRRPTSVRSSSTASASWSPSPQPSTRPDGRRRSVEQSQAISRIASRPNSESPRRAASLTDGARTRARAAPPLRADRRRLRPRRARRLPPPRPRARRRCARRRCRRSRRAAAARRVRPPWRAPRARAPRAAWASRSCRTRGRRRRSRPARSRRGRAPPRRGWSDRARARPPPRARVPAAGPAGRGGRRPPRAPAPGRSGRSPRSARPRAASPRGSPRPRRVPRDPARALHAAAPPRRLRRTPPAPAPPGSSASAGRRRRARAARRSSILAPSWIDAELGELLAQRVAVDAEQRGGAQLVAARARHDRLEQRTLHALEQAAEQLGRLGARERRLDLAGDEGLERGALGLARPGRRGREEGEVLGAEHVAGREHERALDGVLELAHVAGPVVRDEPDERLGGRDHAPPGQRLRIAPEEVIDERGDVVAPLPQRRNVDRHHAQAIEQILAEATA